jgi:hypothetical protein
MTKRQSKENPSATDRARKFHRATTALAATWLEARLFLIPGALEKARNEVLEVCAQSSACHQPDAVRRIEHVRG